MGIFHRLPVFERCCFCIPLRIGVAVVGYWSIVSFVFGVKYLPVYHLPIADDKKSVTDKHFVLMASIGFTINLMANMKVESSGGPKLMARAYMFRTINIIILVVYVVLSVMLLIGAHKRKPEYLRHFFVSSLVMTTAHVVCLAFGFIYQRHWLLFVYLLWIATNVYSLLIVRSSFLAMEEKERGPKRCDLEQEVCWDTMRLAHVV